MYILRSLRKGMPIRRHSDGAFRHAPRMRFVRRIPRMRQKVPYWGCYGRTHGKSLGGKAMYAYCGKILVADLEKKAFHTEPLEDNTALRFIGGRGMNIARLFADERRHIDPLSPESRFYIGVSPSTAPHFRGPHG